MSEIRLDLQVNGKKKTYTQDFVPYRKALEYTEQGLNEIANTARTALSKSEENARDIEEIKETQKWTWRTIAGIGVSVVVYLFTKFLGG